MFEISQVIHTRLPATPEDLQAIIRSQSQITTYIYDSHPDVFVLKPLEDKVSISIDQVHRLHDSLSLSPVMGEQKVILIHPAHALTIPAQQAILKMVEEPPSRVLFLLVTHTPSVLLPTILSRCRMVSYSLQETGENSSHRAGDMRKEVNEVREVGWNHLTNHAEAIKLSDEHGAKKETALVFINQVIESEHDPHIQKAAIRALGLLHKNINAKLVLDEFLFTFLTWT